MRVLVLVISDNSQPVYAEHRRMWRETPRPEGVEVYFIERSPLVDSSVLVGDTLTTPGEEGHPGIIHKTLDAFDYFLCAGHSYNWVVRTNLSSHYHFPRLVRFLQTKPKTRYYGGMLVNHRDTIFVSGCGMYLTPDVCSILQKHRDAVLDVGIADDVDISRTLQAHGIIPQNVPNACTIVVFLSDVTPDKCWGFHWRLKHVVNEKDRLKVEPQVRRRLMAILAAQDKVNK